MTGSYAVSWGGTHPGCMIILLDQSGSMDETFAGTQAGAGKRKCDMVATILNSLLQELIAANTVGSEIRPRADIAILGYQGDTVAPVFSGALAGRDFVSLSDLQLNPMRVDRKERSDVDETGQEVRLMIYMPVWVDPEADGGTPMCRALQKAAELAERWAATHPNNYPPVIINVTDGMSTDGNPTGPAQKLCQVRTNEGQALLYNLHLTTKTNSKIEYPSSEAEFIGGVDRNEAKFSKQLFEMSSLIPESAVATFKVQTQQTLPLGARGFIFNGDALSVRRMFTFVTKAAGAPTINLSR